MAFSGLLPFQAGRLRPPLLPIRTVTESGGLDPHHCWPLDFKSKPCPARFTLLSHRPRRAEESNPSSFLPIRFRGGAQSAPRSLSKESVRRNRTSLVFPTCRGVEPLRWPNRQALLPTDSRRAEGTISRQPKLPQPGSSRCRDQLAIHSPSTTSLYTLPFTIPETVDFASPRTLPIGDASNGGGGDSNPHRFLRTLSKRVLYQLSDPSIRRV